MQVKHILFGSGRVVSQDDKHIRVTFENAAIGEKSFVYPDAFAKFLTYEDEKDQTDVLALIEERKAADGEAAKQLREERMAKYEEERKHAAEFEKLTKKRARASSKSSQAKSKSSAKAKKS